jgi:hypothetical protein
MKTFFLLLLVIPFYMSCDSEDTNVTDGDKIGAMSSSIDGKSWSSKLAEAFTSNLGVLVINGIDESNTKALDVLIDKKDIVVGSTITLLPIVNASDAANSASYTILGADQLPLKVYNSTSGTVKITSLTATNVKGTFSFEGYVDGAATDKVVIKDGKFDVPLR